MLSKIKMALAAALVLGSASVSFAQTVVPAVNHYDCLGGVDSSGVPCS